MGISNIMEILICTNSYTSERDGSGPEVGSEAGPEAEAGLEPEGEPVTEAGPEAETEAGPGPEQGPEPEPEAAPEAFGLYMSANNPQTNFVSIQGVSTN